MKSAKKLRNDENIRQVVDVLTAANYQSGRTIQSKNGDVEFWVGPGRIPVLALHLYANDDGFEVYMPVSQSNRMDETLNALQSCTAIGPPEPPAIPEGPHSATIA